MSEKRVAIGEIKVDSNDAVLAAYGVGSCVVVVLHDVEKHIGGLAHCLLPDDDTNSLKTPRGAITNAVSRMVRIGAQKEHITAKVIGGSKMFEEFERHAIGYRNVMQARKVLAKLNIPIIAEDVFGNWGRSIFFDVQSGEVKVTSFRHGEKVL
jgi:chemotaxis protein CheD